jgi:TolB-like protein/AraC-like DNA-binding protein/Tfp pilus assembly protein PilF
MKEEVSMDQAFLDKVYEAIENNLANENFGVEKLALEIGISRIHLHRKLKSLTGQSASQIIKESRLKRAMEMLQNNVATSSEISYKVGFGSPSYFTTCFREYFGYPPGKVKRTKSLKTKRKHTITVRYLFASIATFVFVALIVSNILPRINKNEIPDKSIVVLPFVNDSPDQENEHIINGYMMSISDNLSKVKELRVVSISSVEKYRNNPRPNPEIAKEMHVSYLLSAFGQKYGDNIRLTVQLVDASGNLIWSSSYDRKITSVDDHISLQSEIAQLVAGEIEAIITFEEKQLIEHTPTSSLTAYDFYARGREEYQKYSTGNNKREALGKAEGFYNKSLKYDSTFAQAYLGLANVHWAKQSWNEFFSENFMDSALILADKALSYDKKLSEAYLIRGRYYLWTGNAEQAAIEYDKGILYNPNDWTLYNAKAYLYRHGEQVKVLNNAYKAAQLHRGSELVDILHDISRAYIGAGFYEQAKLVADEVLKLKGDSLEYCAIHGFIERVHENYRKAEDYFLKGNKIDSTLNLELAHTYMYLKQYEEALKYFKKTFDHPRIQDDIELLENQRIGYAYWKNGYEKEANDYFEKAKENCINEIQLGRYRTEQYFTYYDLASIYAFLGDKEKAYENLRLFNQRQIMHSWYVSFIKNDYLFDCIKDEPEFQQIVKNAEAKYQEEHERVRQWLEENEML